MDQIIDKISVIEHEASAIMQEASAKKKEIAEQIKQETADFDRKLEEDTARRIQVMRESLESEMKKKLSEQKHMADRDLRRLSQHYESHKKVYIDQLFQEITGV